MSDSWIQLDGVEQILPYEGWNLEQLRRRLLDRLHQNGYEFVIPPLADFVESLSGGTDNGLDVLTVKTPDYVSGRLFGIRADMTPQIARMAAHHLPVNDTIVRLCYFGPTLLARAPYPGYSRELLQYGAELFGSSSPESDREIIRLMIECLTVARVQSLSISLGHVGIVQEMFKIMNFEESLEHSVQNILQSKSKPDLNELALHSELSSDQRDLVSDIITLNGDIDTVDKARKKLSGISVTLDSLLREFEQMVSQLSCENESITFHLDYAQIGGYRYHTGIVFSAYGAGYGRALAKGGRYDSVLSAYGTPCPATGFSGDLNLFRRANSVDGPQKGILIGADAKVPSEKIQALIDVGNRIIRQLPDQTRGSLRAICDREIISQSGKWKVVPFNAEDECK